jgi:hypothetical protein
LGIAVFSRGAGWAEGVAAGSTVMSEV